VCAWRWLWARLRSGTLFRFALCSSLLAVTAVVGVRGRVSGLLQVGPAGLVASVQVADGCRAGFEWMTRRYNPDIDPDLTTDLDYYDQDHTIGHGHVAKAAAHWQVATRLMPAKVEYHTALAKAYIKLDYMAAAWLRLTEPRTGAR